MTYIDSHHHFWRIDRGENDWIDDSISGIRRDYLPEHIDPYLRHLGVTKTILVEASAGDSENVFMSEMAKNAPFVAGIVAWVDFTKPDAPEKLANLSENPLIKGVRPVMLRADDTEPVLHDIVAQNATLLPDLGFTFDAMAVPHLLPMFAQLAEAVPRLPMVIDHCAKPIIKDGQPASDTWRADMATLASHPNMHCKLSGIAHEFGPGWSARNLQPVVDHILEIFGPNRIMWGSDWPVLELSGSYTQWLEAVETMIEGCDDAGKAAIRGGTAARFYLKES